MLAKGRLGCVQHFNCATAVSAAAAWWMWQQWLVLWFQLLLLPWTAAPSQGSLVVLWFL
jgi:hypothetical protein